MTASPKASPIARAKILMRWDSATAPLPARLDLLHRPAVAVGIAEEDEPAPREVLHLGDLDPALDEVRMRRLDVRDDELHALHGPGLGVGDPRAERDRAARSGRRQLHEAHLVADDVVVIG